MIGKKKKQGLAMIHTHYDMMIAMEEATYGHFAQLHAKKLELKALL